MTFDYKTGKYLFDPSNPATIGGLATGVPLSAPATPGDGTSDATPDDEDESTETDTGDSGEIDMGTDDLSQDTSMPAPVAAPIQPGSSIHQSGSGFSGSKFSQVGQSLGARGIESQYDDVAKYGVQAQTNQAARMAQGTADSQDANQATANVASAQAKAQYQAEADLQDLQSKTANDAEVARQQARQLAQAARASYQQRTQALAAMEINPAAGIAGMTPLNKGVSAMALFAQGMLATKGINIDVRGTLDTWVDRTIQAQRDQISRGEKLSDADQTMWNMVRQESTDDADARTRVSGYLLARAQAHVQSIATQFAGPVAQAQAGQANAALQAKLYDAYGDVENKTYSIMSDDVNKKAQWRIEQGHLALASQSNALAQAKLGLEAGKLNQYKDIGGVFLQGKRIATFRGSATKPEIQKLHAQSSAADALLDDLAEYKQLSADAHYAGPGSTKFSELSARVTPILNRIQSEMAQLNQIGQNQTESEMARIYNELPENSWTNFESDQINPVIDDLQAAITRNVGYGMKDITTAPSAEDLAYDAANPPSVGAYGTDRNTTYNLGANAKPPEVTPDDIGRLHATRAQDDDATSDSKTKYWTDFLKSGSAVGEDGDKAALVQGNDAIKNVKPFSQAPAMEAIADRAKANTDKYGSYEDLSSQADEVAKALASIPSSDREARKAAMGALNTLHTEMADYETLHDQAADDSSPRRQAFAAYLLTNVVGVPTSAGPTVAPADYSEDDPGGTTQHDAPAPAPAPKRKRR